MKNSIEPVFIEGKRVLLRPLLEEDFTREYLNWLNDPHINRHSQRRPFPSSEKSMRSYNDYYLENPGKGFVLAVVDRKTGTHIGNISMVNIQPLHRCAEIAILIGNRDFWNRGYGRESIHLLTRHGFIAMNLNRIFAGSFNPAFISSVEKNGWKKEGEFRQRIWSNGRYRNQVWMAILRDEFQENPEFEKE